MSTIAHALTTKENIKDRIDIDVVGFDQLIDDFIAQATSYLESACDRRFKETVYTSVLLNGSPINDRNVSMEYLVLPNAPVRSVSSIKYRTGLNTSPTYVTMSANEYDVLSEEGIIYCSGGFPKGHKNLQITYTAGYLVDFANKYNTTLHTLPFDIQDIVERMVIKLFTRRRSTGRTQEGFRESNVVWADLIDKSDLQIIANYSRPRVL